MKWRIEPKSWSYRKFALLPKRMMNKDWVWLERYWEGCINTPYGAACWQSQDRKALHEGCSVPIDYITNHQGE